LLRNIFRPEKNSITSNSHDAFKFIEPVLDHPSTRFSAADRFITALCKKANAHYRSKHFFEALESAQLLRSKERKKSVSLKVSECNITEGLATIILDKLKHRHIIDSYEKIKTENGLVLEVSLSDLTEPPVGYHAMRFFSSQWAEAIQRFENDHQTYEAPNEPWDCLSRAAIAEILLDIGYLKAKTTDHRWTERQWADGKYIPVDTYATFKSLL